MTGQGRQSLIADPCSAKIKSFQIFHHRQVCQAGITNLGFPKMQSGKHLCLAQGNQLLIRHTRCSQGKPRQLRQFSERLQHRIACQLAAIQIHVLEVFKRTSKGEIRRSELQAMV